MNNSYTIGVSCVGSGIGQSVINSLNLSRLPIKTIGLSNNPFSYGAYDCDEYYYTPAINSPGYIDLLIEMCHKHNIDLIIPGYDEEVKLFAENIDKFNKAGIKTIVSGIDLVMQCWDKETMYNKLNGISHNFVKSFNKKTLLKEIKKGNLKYPYIAKPRFGSGSIGVKIIGNERDLHLITDEDVIQEIALPHTNDPNYDHYIKKISENLNLQVSEISIQIVTGKNQEILGKMISYQKLKNGIDIEIVPFENEQIWESIDKLLPHLLELGLRGPINIGGRLTDEGLKLFEINPRFTGVTGMRALMGFNEVVACVKNWLDIDDGNNSLELNYNRFGVRQTSDRTIPIYSNRKVQNLFNYINKGKLKPGKTILITGAAGTLGRSIIEKISKSNNYTIWALDQDREKTTKLVGKFAAECFGKSDIRNGAISFGNIDTLLHLGFLEPDSGNSELADNLALTNDLFFRAAQNAVSAIINISSQSVYGKNLTPPLKENTAVSPDTPYTLAIYSSELMLESVRTLTKYIKTTSLRLADISGIQSEYEETDLIAKFVKQSLLGKPLIINGQQTFEMIDVRDAADGIARLLALPPGKWKHIYNLGSGNLFNINHLAEKVAEIVKVYTGQNEPAVINLHSKPKLCIGMDSKSFFRDTNWKPRYTIDDTIRSLIENMEKDIKE